MHTLKIALLAATTLALAACGEPAEKQSEKARDELRAKESVAAAAGTSWPDGPEVDEFDPMRTRDNLMLAVDMSGSMDGGDCAGDYYSKADAAKDAIGTWLKSVPEQANVGVAAFVDGKSELFVPLGTNNRRTIIETVKGFRPNGGTPLSEVIDLAEQELENQARYQQGYGSYRVVVITDGAHSGGYDPRPVVERILGNPANPVEIHTIGFCVDENHALNQPGLTHYRSATNPTELKAGLESVLAESESFDAADFEALSPEGAANN